MFKDDIEFKTELKKHKDEKLVSKRIRKYRPRGGVGWGGGCSESRRYIKNRKVSSSSPTTCSAGFRDSALLQGSG